MQLYYTILYNVLYIFSSYYHSCHIDPDKFCFEEILIENNIPTMLQHFNLFQNAFNTPLSKK